MAIGNDKIRTVITLTREDREVLEELAKEDNRNLSNYVNTILKKHIEQKQLQKHLVDKITNS